MPNDFDFDAPEQPDGPRDIYHAEFDEDAAAAGKGPRAHRGVLILVFGILSIILGMIAIVPCPIPYFFTCQMFNYFTAWSTGIMAMSMANSDLLGMAQGGIDRSGRGLTQAGRVCGILGMVLTTCSFIVLLVLVFILASR